MRTVLLIAAAGLTGLFVAAAPVRAQYYGWGYYRPYYPVPYGYYPGPYYAPPPPFYDPPAQRYYPRPTIARSRHHIVVRRTRVVHRPLVNPLLGPLPSATPPRRN